MRLVLHLLDKKNLELQSVLYKMWFRRAELDSGCIALWYKKLERDLYCSLRNSVPTFANHGE